MAKLDAMPQQAVIDGLAGVIDFYVDHGIPVARSWPKQRTTPFTPQEQLHWQIFGIAVTAWTNVDSETREFLMAMTPASSLSARDLATKLYLNGSTIITNVTENAFCEKCG